MDSAPTDPDDRDDARTFVEEILRTGLMLTDLFADLVENLSENAFPGEDPGEVLLEMLTGTIRPATRAAGRETTRDATVLLGAVRDRVLTDLRAALELARRE